jgi:short-chain fatty acids transporter
MDNNRYSIQSKIFAGYNLFIYVLGLIVLPILIKYMHPKADKVVTVDPSVFADEKEEAEKLERKSMTPAQKMEHSKVLNTSLLLWG